MNHYLLALVSGIIYERTDVWRRTSFNELGIKQVAYFNRSRIKRMSNRVQAMMTGQGTVETAILRHQNGTLIVACRGSQGFKDWIGNFEPRGSLEATSETPKYRRGMPTR